MHDAASSVPQSKSALAPELSSVEVFLLLCVEVVEVADGESDESCPDSSLLRTGSDENVAEVPDEFEHLGLSPPFPETNLTDIHYMTKQVNERLKSNDAVGDST